MRRTTSALFLDFDNIFSGLLALDREAALAMATKPGELVERLSVHGLGDGARRDLLVRRAYLNPAGTVQDKDLGNANGNLYFNRFRPHLVRAGFEVIDCPALTTRQKNAADIRIVIDVLAALDAPVRYDEIIVASSDADFTPLLLKLRAEDRRTTIITAGVLAPAYQAVADRYIDEQSFIALLVPTKEPADDGEPADDAEFADEEEPDASAAATSASKVSPEQAEALAHAALARVVADAPEPVNLSWAGAALHEAAGTESIRATNWFGHKTLSAFVIASNPSLRVASNLVWDPARHPDPIVEAAADAGIPALIVDLSAAIDLPRLPPLSWAAAFEALGSYAATHVFSLTEATAWARDLLAEQGHPVGRQVLGYIIRGCLYASVRLDAHPPPTAEQLRRAFVTSVTERARSAGVDPDYEDLKVLDAYLSGAW